MILDYLIYIRNLIIKDFFPYIDDNLIINIISDILLLFLQLILISIILKYILKKIAKKKKEALYLWYISELRNILKLFLTDVDNNDNRKHSDKINQITFNSQLEIPINTRVYVNKLIFLLDSTKLPLSNISFSYLTSLFENICDSLNIGSRDKKSLIDFLSLLYGKKYNKHEKLLNVFSLGTVTSDSKVIAFLWKKWEIFFNLWSKKFFSVENISENDWRLKSIFINADWHLINYQHNDIIGVFDCVSYVKILGLLFKTKASFFYYTVKENCIYLGTANTSLEGGKSIIIYILKIIAFVSAKLICYQGGKQSKKIFSEHKYLKKNIATYKFLEFKDFIKSQENKQQEYSYNKRYDINKIQKLIEENKISLLANYFLKKNNSQLYYALKQISQKNINNKILQKQNIFCFYTSTSKHNNLSY